MARLLDGFRGNWDLPFIARRYLQTFARNSTPYKISNVALALTEMAMARSQLRSLPFAMRLEPTSTCNLRCPRCSTGLGIEPRPKGFLAMEDLDYLLEQTRKHLVFIRFDGNGEPLLHPEISEQIAHIKRAGIGVDVSSHLNNEPKGGMDAFVESGIDRIMVAIDGSTQETYERYRVGGNLDKVLNNLQNLVDARNRCKQRKPLIIDLQFLNWGYNAHQIPDMRKMARQFGVDRLTLIEPDKPASSADILPLNPKRCFWLWCVVTLDWELNYHTCTNAWTYPFPQLNAKTSSPRAAWNAEPFVEARKFNKNKNSALIAGDRTCMCNRCTDMLVVKRPPGYVCE